MCGAARRAPFDELVPDELNSDNEQFDVHDAADWWATDAAAAHLTRAFAERLERLKGLHPDRQELDFHSQFDGFDPGFVEARCFAVCRWGAVVV